MIQDEKEFRRQEYQMWQASQGKTEKKSFCLQKEWGGRRQLSVKLLYCYDYEQVVDRSEQANVKWLSFEWYLTENKVEGNLESVSVSVKGYMAFMWSRDGELIRFITFNNLWREDVGSLSWREWRRSPHKCARFVKTTFHETTVGLLPRYHFWMSPLIEHDKQTQTRTFQRLEDSAPSSQPRILPQKCSILPTCRSWLMEWTIIWVWFQQP